MFTNAVRSKWLILLVGTFCLHCPQTREYRPKTKLRGAIARRELRETSTRAAHAGELLGVHHHITLEARTARNLTPAIHQLTLRSFKGPSHIAANHISQAILQESHNWHLDPLFLMAVIERESRFVPTVVGAHGEIGLMQLRPATAEWIAKKYNLPWAGKITLLDPVMNIRIGAAYLSFLRDSFKHRGGDYLAAYNLGPKKTKEMIGEGTQPKEYADQVISNYIRFHSQLKELTANSYRPRLASFH